MSRREALLAKLRVVALERAAKARSALEGGGVEGEREMHTLKGEAQLLGRPRLASVADRLERLWAHVGSSGGTPPLRAIVVEGLDLVEALAGDDDAAEVDGFLRRADELLAAA